jgi:hypothetical protein
VRRFIEQRVRWPWSFVLTAALFFVLFLVVSSVWDDDSWLQRLAVGGLTTLFWGLVMWFWMNPGYRRDEHTPTS